MSTQPPKATRLSDADIDAIKRANPLLNTVEQHVTLRRSGSTYKGLCPFHDERTPSFHVNPATETWRCFGCQLHGDVIDFIREIEGGNFRYAATLLAQQSGVTIEGADDSDDDEQARRLRARIYEANEAASAFYTSTLLNDPDAQTARTFLAERKFTAEHATEYACGYAPRRGQTLNAFLRDNGFSTDEIVTAGLARIAKDSDRLYDVFQGRLIWTIRSEFDKVIGFGARRLYDDDWQQGKFINTSETPVYKKSDVLYGFERARKTAVKNRHIYVVEGYADVMAAQIAGVANTVATCGTAFTREHLRTLRRTVGEHGEITFGLDDDAAGRKASMSVYDLAHTSVRRLTTLGGDFGGKDPDDVRKHHGDEALRTLFANRKPLLQSVITATIAAVDIHTPEDKAIALDQAAPLLAHVSDPVVRSEYVTQVANLVGVKPADVTARLNDTTPTAPEPATPTGVDDNLDRVERCEQQLLRIFVQSEIAARALHDECRILLVTPHHQALSQAIHQALKDNPERLWFERIKKHVHEDAYSTLITYATLGSPSSDDVMFDYARQLIDQLRQGHVEETTHELVTQLAATSSSEEERIDTLIDLIELARNTH